MGDTSLRVWRLFLPSITFAIEFLDTLCNEACIELKVKELELKIDVCDNSLGVEWRFGNETQICWVGNVTDPIPLRCLS